MSLLTTNTLKATNDVSDWVANNENSVQFVTFLIKPTGDYSGVLKVRTQAHTSGSDTVPTVADTELKPDAAPPTSLTIAIPPGYRVRLALTTGSAGSVFVQSTLTKNFNITLPTLLSGIDKLAASTAVVVTQNAVVATQKTACDTEATAVGTTIHAAIALVITHLGADSGGNSVAQAITDLTAANVTIATAGTAITAIGTALTGVHTALAGIS